MKTKTWRDPSRYIRTLHVAEDVLHLDYTNAVIKNLNLPLNIVPAGETPQGIAGSYPDNLNTGKTHLFLCENKGNFFKPCPATTEYQCCDYQVLNIGSNCPMDCVYCILQAYLNNPWITSFVNIDKMFVELDTALRAEPERFFRIGTGEFTDSLALEPITGISQKLIPFLASYDNVVLELKTKSANVEMLDGLSHQGKTLLSWSLNSPPIMRFEEIRSATLQERLNAARLAADYGYGLSFHFDPIVYHDGWQQGYSQTIKALFDNVPAEAIAWISLGALRFLPALKDIATQRFSHSKMFYQEFITGLDGKTRYFRKQREEMYRYIVSELHKKISADTCLYFCMESDDIWQEIFGYSPDTYGGIPAMLDKAAIKAISKY